MNKLKEFKILKMRYKKTKMYQIKNKMLQLPQNLILFKIFQKSKMPFLTNQKKKKVSSLIKKH